MIGLIIGYIIIGAIIGALARLAVPGRQTMGIGLTILLGIVGAVVGGLIAAAIHLGTLLTLLVSVAVAALLVFLVAGGSRNRTTARY
jgi:uncharacterized membrane protein YeaQ/YmgE (transglycosylase-associated protein family)